MFRLSPETVEDGYEVEYLFDLAFAPGREALSSYRLRDGVPPIAQLSLVARDQYGTLGGAIRFWPISIGDRGDEALLLGPVAVHPTRQGEGLGAILMHDSLELATGLGWRAVLLVGDEPYYGRYGFARIDGLLFPQPLNPARLLARSLVPSGLDGLSGEVTRSTGALHP